MVTVRIFTLFNVTSNDTMKAVAQCHGGRRPPTSLWPETPSRSASNRAHVPQATQIEHTYCVTNRFSFLDAHCSLQDCRYTWPTDHKWSNCDRRKLMHHRTNITWSQFICKLFLKSLPYSNKSPQIAKQCAPHSKKLEKSEKFKVWFKKAPKRNRYSRKYVKRNKYSRKYVIPLKLQFQRLDK